LEKGSEVRRKPKSEPSFHYRDLGIRQTGIELDPVDRGVGCDHPEAVLGAAELIH
jgi:hypothetical protein